MDIRILPDLASVGCLVGERFAEAVRRDPAAVVGLATGSSPLAAYREWARIAQEEGLDLSEVRGFALDEYLGVDPADPRSYHAVIREEVVDVVGLDPALVRVPRASSLATADAAGSAYEREIREAGGIGIQILGIGRNGHLAFNEPGSPADSRTRGVALAAETRADNARFFDAPEDVPTHAITQGLGTILEARELVVIAAGPATAPAVAAAIDGPETEDLPASLLRRHPRATWFLDEAAASLLAR